MEQPKIYIGIPTAGYSRNSMFYDYVNMLEKPVNTCGASFHTDSGAHNRNLIIDDAIAADATHILFIDDDMAFPANSLMRLLAHDKDVVSGLYYNRVYPHPPLLFSWVDKSLSTKRRYLQDNEHGLIKVDACGFGFLLVKTHIFQYMAKPYVRIGEIQQDKKNEDIGFCDRVRQAGFDIFCDLDVVCGHMGTATFWPGYDNGRWITIIDTGDSKENVFCEQKKSEIEVKTPLSHTKNDDMYTHMLDLIDKQWL